MSRRVALALLLVLLMVTPVEVAASDTLGNLLAFLTQSALMTDRLQSSQWLHTTAEDPLITPKGYVMYEALPWVAGQRVEDGWFDFLDTGTDALQLQTSPLARKVQVLWGIGTVANVIRNNRNSEIAGLTQYWALKYRWRF
jgi:hypothetical protein